MQGKMSTIRPPETKQNRQRRSHVRTFTGCQECRQRHVKCDEGRPTCDNCNRMGIECSAYPFKIDMRVFTPKSLEAAEGRKRVSHKKVTREDSLSPPDFDPTLSSLTEYSTVATSSETVRSVKSSRTNPTTFTTMRHQVISQEDDGDESIPGQMVLIPQGSLNPQTNGKQAQSPTKLVEKKTIVPTQPAQVLRHHVSLSPFLKEPSQSIDVKFFSHFLSTVSTLLIVYDNPHNANPYRLVFPSLANDSVPLQEAMNALGALHLANTTPPSGELNLKAMAISRYSRCVHSLREVLMSERAPKLADLATILLLTFFEMMDSDTNNWQTHLKGAKHVFERLFSPSTILSIQDEAGTAGPTQVVRNFLISALAYLDMAGAVSTAKMTQLKGPYWDIVGGGWQYNLGVPSLNATLQGRLPEDDNLSDLRKVWSKLMMIQNEVGRFAMEIENGCSATSIIQRRTEIQRNLTTWRSNLPEIFHHLDDSTTDNYHADSIEGASCVLCYESATIIYFHQVSGANHESTRTMNQCIDTILAIFVRYGHGVSQMGMLWALFIAGTEAQDDGRQAFVRTNLQNMLSFGMGNVKRALQLLELVWLRRRQTGMEIRWFIIQRELQWTLLLP